MSHLQFSPPNIENKIYLIRGERVMLDDDLAELYGVSTKALNQSVVRNLERFPNDFMFQLSADEFALLRSQSVTSKPSGRGGRRYLPRAFTEQGIAMLSTVLNSHQAIQVNILIIRTFVRFRSMLSSNRELTHRLDMLEAKYDRKFKIIFEAIRKLMSNHTIPPKRIIGLEKKDE
jgi:hypothetical protein